MSEITKLYENVGIKLGCCKYAEYGYEGEEGTWYYCKKEGKGCWTYPNGDADCVEKGYPPFTAEKQIELIKFITSLGVCEIENWNDNGFHFAIKRERIYPTMFLSLSNISLQETLADVINNLWQDLTEEEKQQVKGILE